VVVAVDLVIQEVVAQEDRVVVKDIVQLAQLREQVILLQQVPLKEILVVQELFQLQEDLVVEVVVPQKLDLIDQAQV
jgi:hypothetical protein|tara:strand:+ start:506 stop:736 length:231 start_codon:yes stop_codon:yes gene_type:complete